MGEAFGTYGKRRAALRFWWGDKREADRLEDVGVDGRIRLKLTFQKLVRGMTCIYLA